MAKKSTIKAFLSKPDTARSNSKMGEGSYSKVFDSDGFMPGTVVKHYNRKSAENRYGEFIKEGCFVDAWLVWALYCMSVKHRSFMPKIFALHIDWERGTYHAIMEKLHKCHRPIYICTELEYAEQNIQLRDTYGIRKENMIRAFKDIEKLAPEFFYLDGHSDNWMKRRGFGKSTSIVATDPLHITFSNMRKPAMMRKFNELIYKMSKEIPNVMMVGQPNLAAYDEDIKEE